MDSVPIVDDHKTKVTPTKVIEVMHKEALGQSSADYCIYKGKRYAINERIEDGCEEICKCMASSGSVECEARCPKMNHTTAMHEQCVTVPDPKDLCCHIELCDVTLDDHEQGGAISIVPAPPSLVNAMKQKNANRTNVALNERASTAASTIDAVHDPNEKFDCEHNGIKYTKGTNFNYPLRRKKFKKNLAENVTKPNICLV